MELLELKETLLRYARVLIEIIFGKLYVGVEGFSTFISFTYFSDISPRTFWSRKASFISSHIFIFHHELPRASKDRDEWEECQFSS